MSETQSEKQYEPIAIIGMGCRFPGGICSPEEYWEVLRNGIDCLTEIPSSRWDLKTFYSSHKDKPGKMIIGRGGYISGHDEFDPQFFGIIPREAEYLDPQQRKLLEVAWEALEDAGQKPSELAGRPVGVFIGAFTLDYKILQFGGRRHDNLAANTAVGVMMTMVSNRISYIFDFRGPSISLDTACSSSMTAIHLACESIRSGESCMALAGGVMLQSAPQYTISESKGGFMSPTGTSHGFDSSANGYVRAEGAGIVVLKRLSEAQRDGDPIYAVILGDGANQDGRTNGITVPNGEAQKEIILKVCEKAGVQPGKLQYVEAHGTGTPVGDPIEANALGEVLGIGRKEGDKCYIGSVKTNIGHTESAAGVAGLMKVALSLKNKQIPPHLHLKEINPKIRIEQWPYEIPTSLVPWPEHQGAALAGVNSFGFGGTNSHAILQEAPDIKPVEKSLVIDGTERPAVLTLSTRDPEVFPAIAEKYKAFLSKDGCPPLADIGYTLSFRRERLEHRLSFVYSSKEDLIKKFDLCISGEENPLVVKGKKLADGKRKLIWVFTGMGPQWWAMGRELYRKEPVFTEMINRCDAEMSKYTNWSLIEELINKPEADSKMAETWLSQPANFAIQVALAALWRSFGIRPDGIVGHSTGEAAAFYEAGVYSFEDAVKVIIHRSRLQQTVSGTGKMVAVGMPEAEIQEKIKLYGDKISVAAVNSPRSVTISGNEQALAEFIKPLQEQGVFCKFLQVQIPFHSAYMEPIKDELLDCLKDIKPMKAKVRLYTTGTGVEAEGTELDAAYWWINVRGAVLFTKAMNKIIDDGFNVFLEIGPHPVLAGSISECVEDRKKEAKMISSLKRKELEQEKFVAALAELINLGFDIDWNIFYGAGKITRLPTYPWKKDIYWTEPEDVQRRRKGLIDHPLLGFRQYTPSPSWEMGISTEQQPYLKDHCIQGNVVFPAAGYIEMALSASKLLLGSGVFAVDDLEIKKALFISDDREPRVQFLVDEENASFRIATYNDDTNNAVLHATGRICTIQSTRIAPVLDVEGLKARLESHMESKKCYRKLHSMGYEYAYFFQGIQELWLGSGEALARIKMKEELTGLDSYYFHPTLTDACFQALIAAEFNRGDKDSNMAIRLPVSIGRIRLPDNYAGEVWAHAKITESTNEKMIGDIFLYDQQWNSIGEIKNFAAFGVDQASGGVSLSTIDNALYKIAWEEKEREAKVEKDEKKPSKDGGWLIFADKQGVSREIAGLLKEKGEYFSFVYPSEKFEIDVVEGVAKALPDSKEQFINIINKFFKEKGKKCKGIIHLWNLDAPDMTDTTLESLQEVKGYGCFSIINIVKAISETGIATRLRIITRGAQSLGENAENICVAASPVWGIGRVLGQQELVENWGGIIDLDPANKTTAMHDDAVKVLEEINDHGSEDLLAFRTQKRYVCRINQVSGFSSHLPTKFRADGCYIVTGAFGALGQLVCRMMIKHGARRLVLMARTRIPPRTEWAYIGKNNDAYEKIAFIKELEAMGAEVILASVDLCDEAQVSDYFKQFKRLGYPPVRGVIHSAGIVNDLVATQMDKKAFDSVYDTKVFGSYLLHKYLIDEPLDYFVMFSSVATLVTTSGQTNYAAGNAFLDGLAHYRRAAGLPALSINWGPWAVGMIKELNLIEHYKNRRGMNCTLPEVGMSMLDRAMGQDVPQIMACEADWTKVLAWYPKAPAIFGHLAKKDTTQDNNEKVSFASLFRAADLEGRKTLVEDHLADLIAKVLRCKRSQIDSNTTLNMLGLDSIMATELRNKISFYFGHTLTIVKLLSGSSIQQLAEEMVNGLLESLRDEGLETSMEEAAPSIEESGIGLGISSADELDVEDEYPLSYGQKAIWFINQLMPESPAYNISGALHIPARLDVEVLRKAIREIIKRYPALRTNFFIKDGEPYQRVCSARKEDLEVFDVYGKEWEEIRALMIAESKKPFNLEKDPLYRIRVYKQGEESYYFAVTIYHIISDAWSNYMFIDEMQVLYDKFANGKDLELEPVNVSYKEFIDLENRMVNTSRGTKMYNYWRNHLPHETPVLNLPIDKPRPVVMTNNGSSVSFVLSEELSRSIKELSRATGATIFMTLLSGFYTLLHKYSGQEDIIIGTPVAGRSNPKFEKVYGYFVNMLPLRTTFKGDPTFKTLLKHVQNSVLMGLENQEYPYALLVDRLGFEHDPSRSAVFQVMFVYLFHKVEQTGMDENNVASYAGFPMKLLDIPEEEGQYEITLSMHEENGRLHAIFKYNTDLFNESTIRKMADNFTVLLEEAAINPDKRISEINMLTSEEKNKILGSFKGLRKEEVSRKCIHEIFEEIALEKPDSIAVSVPYEDDSRETITYDELNKKANQYARYLRDKGVKPNTFVGICLDKSVDLIVSLLAVMKAGGTYIPIDPGYPADRIVYILDHSGAEYIISKTAFKDILHIGSRPIIYFDENVDAIAGFDGTNQKNANNPSDLLYIIYTSGSTGQPKGVKIAHKSLASIYSSWEKKYRLKEDVDAHLQMASFSFDVFSGDLVRALCSGGKLVLCRREVLLNIPLLYKVLNDEGINCAEFVPSIMRKLVKYLQTSGKRLSFMKVMIVGSDVWTVDEFKMLKALCGENTRLINSYGLSEASVDSTYFEGDVSGYESGSTVPIGKPFPNTQVYILDMSMNPVPVGVPGEMYIGGHGLAEGYVNDKQLTDEKFIMHSFFDASEIRLYKTGDLAKWDDKGNIHILQRIDNQVKIRGYRIELGEIEKSMLNCPGVSSAVAAARNDRNGDKVICAYFIPEDKQMLDAKKLQEMLAEKLPSYMLPAYCIQMEEFPLNPNGKIDLNSLPAPEFIENKEELTEPVTMYEKRVADIWKKLLGIHQIGLESEFFNIGGNSLYLIELMMQLQSEFRIKVAVNQLFKASTLEGMAKTVEDIVTGKEKGAEPFIEYNPGCRKALYCFPPAGGYSIVYKNLADAMKDFTLMSYNYLTEEDKIKLYSDMILAQRHNGPYVLFGYSLGGNLAFEVAKELEKRGAEVSDVIIMDSYRITGEFKPTEKDVEKFEHELAEHFKKHTGSTAVQKHTVEQAKNYIDFCYSKTNEGNIKARVHFIIEQNNEDLHREHRKISWDGSSESLSRIYEGNGSHAEMLDKGIVEGNAGIIRRILG